MPFPFSLSRHQTILVSEVSNPNLATFHKPNIQPATHEEVGISDCFVLKHVLNVIITTQF